MQVHKPARRLLATLLLTHTSAASISSRTAHKPSELLNHESTTGFSGFSYFTELLEKNDEESSQPRVPTSNQSARAGDAHQEVDCATHSLEQTRHCALTCRGLYSTSRTTCAYSHTLHTRCKGSTHLQTDAAPAAPSELTLTCVTSSWSMCTIVHNPPADRYRASSSI